MTNKAAKLMDYFKKSNHLEQLEEDLKKEAEQIRREIEAKKMEEALRKYQQASAQQSSLHSQNIQAHQQVASQQQQQAWSQQWQQLWNNPSYGGSATSLGYWNASAERRISDILAKRTGKHIEGLRVEDALPFIAEILAKLDAQVPEYIHLGDQKKKGQSTVSCECGSDAIKHAIHADWCPAIQKKGEK